MHLFIFTNVSNLSTSNTIHVDIIYEPYYSQVFQGDTFASGVYSDFYCLHIFKKYLLNYNIKYYN